jgi:hypothetical protein
MVILTVEVPPASGIETEVSLAVIALFSTVGVSVESLSLLQEKLR